MSALSGRRPTAVDEWVWFEHVRAPGGDSDPLQAALRGTVGPPPSSPEALPNTVAIAVVNDAPSASLAGDTPAAWAPFVDSVSADSRAAWRNLKNCYLLVHYTVA